MTVTALQTAFVPDGFCNEIEAARYLRISARTLANWRSEGRGPRFARLSRRIVYRRQDLDQYAEARMVEVSG